MPDVQRQLDKANSGFVLAVEYYDKENGKPPSSDDRKQQTMSYFPWGQLEATHPLGLFSFAFTFCLRLRVCVSLLILGA